MPSLPTAVILGAFALGIIVVYLFLRIKRSRRLPPGPPADPLIGHLRVLPREDPHHTYYEWSKLYGTSPKHSETYVN